MIKIVDDFLDDYEWFRELCDFGLQFKDEVNPADGVSYPGICTSIPESIRAECIYKAQRLIEEKISKATIFLRLSTEGHEAPHAAHNDAAMGDYAMMLYMNKYYDCDGGTSFVSHKQCGMPYGPKNQNEQDIWHRDTNKNDAWSVDEMVKMKENRSVLFEAGMMHRAEPNGGFGDDASNGRLVLVCFFGVCND